MKQPLDELYLTWLYSQLSSVKVKSKSRSHWKLVQTLYSTEFVWFVPNDDNRAADGQDLRYEFILDSGVEDVDSAWLNLGCSMLEMLIGLARRLSFQGDGEPRVWFWHLIENLNLYTHTDKAYFEDQVKDILNKVINRNYEPNGLGGLFPLEFPDRDQRRVELWYQLSSYLMERG